MAFSELVPSMKVSRQSEYYAFATWINTVDSIRVYLTFWSPLCFVGLFPVLLLSHLDRYSARKLLHGPLEDVCSLTPSLLAMSLSVGVNDTMVPQLYASM